jgi:hypothetical protein
MASGAMVHPCEFFDFCILQRCGLGQGTGKVLFPAKKSKTPFLTWTVNYFLFYISQKRLIISSEGSVNDKAAATTASATAAAGG